MPAGYVPIVAPRTRSVGTWLRWWLLCMILWLVLTSTVAATELVAGVIASALAATVGYAVTRHDDFVARAPAVWASWFLALPRRVVVDTGLVTAALMRTLRGHPPNDEFTDARLPIDAHNRPERDARHALTTLFVSASPNAFVVGIDDERGTALLHTLVPPVAATVDEVLRGK